MTSTDTFPTDQQFRDDLAQIAAEVKRHREVQALLPELVAALDGMMDCWLDYHDSHSLTQPVTGRSKNAFDRALNARDRAKELLR